MIYKMADDRIHFKTFCELCEKIKSSTSPAEKELKLCNFINEYKKCSAENSHTNMERTFYPVLRLLIPQYERERGPYGLKETNFAKLIKRSLPLSNGDSNNLEQYRLNLSGRASKDFADVAYFVLKKFCPLESNVTIAEVNSYLDNIATKHAEHKLREIENDVFEMCMKSTANEQKWIIRIVLKDMKLGLGNNHILRIFHPDAVDLYDVCNDLSKVCKLLKNPNVRLHELDINIFTPFRPMLCLTCDAEILNNITKDNKKFYVENKFDGERFQVHMKDGTFEYYSKNGHRYTDCYGANFDSGGLITPYLKESFENVKSVILDGEMMGWNKNTKKFGSKGMSYDVKKLKSENVHRPCYCVFDILLYNDEILTNKPLNERLKILENLIKPVEGVILKSRYVEVDSLNGILDELNKTVDKQEEGICFKDPNSIYKPNNRKAGWWKMKLEYFDGLMTELDVLIIGVFYSDGGSVGVINSFLMGVAVDSENRGEDPKEFHSFARVASGLSRSEYSKLMLLIRPHLKPVTKNSTRQGGIFWTKEKPDLWIEPSKSCILQIRASELTRSSEFKTNYTLRFPRIEKVRDDKPWYNCMTLSELNELTKSSKAVQKLTSRHIKSSDVEIVPKKRKKTIVNEIPGIDLSTITIKSNLLKNKEIYVISGNDEITKHNVEIMVCENSGSVVQLQGPKTYCIVMGHKTAVLPLLQSRNTHDVIKLDSFMRALKDVNSTLQWTPQDFIIMANKTKIKLSAYFDKYGDSHTEQILNKTALVNIMENIKNEEDYLNLLPNEMNDFDKIIRIRNPLGLFRMCNAYFDNAVSDGSKRSTVLEEMENMFRFYGGQISSFINCDTTHVIMYSRDVANLEEITNLVSAQTENIKIVSEKWILNSIKQKEIILENNYMFT